MRKISILLLLLLLLLFLVSCESTQTEFDRKKWDICVDGFCDYRESMTEDLMRNNLKKGMSVNDVLKLLGKPNYYVGVGNKFGYDVFVDYGRNIDPVETKFLEFEIKDSLVLNYKIKHWKQE